MVALPSAAKADPAPATSDAPRPAVARATAVIRAAGFMTRFDIRGKTSGQNGTRRERRAGLVLLFLGNPDPHPG
jgi:hypothetical protein